CTCGDTQNIFHAMRMLCLLPAVTQSAPTPITAGYAMRAATLSGANAGGLRRRGGALRPGMLAGIVVVGLAGTPFLPLNSAARQLVFSEAGSAVDSVFVSGRPVVEGGKVISIDEAALADDVHRCSQAFRRDAAALVERNRPHLDALLRACKIASDVPLEIERYIDGCSTEKAGRIH